jgi:DNA modification methylase
MVKLKLPVLLLCLLIPSVRFQNITGNSSEANTVVEPSTNFTHFYTIDVNDSITVDYMDDSSWSKFSNMSFDDVFYSESMENVDKPFSQNIMNQLKMVETSEVGFTNESVDQFNNETISLMKLLKAQNLLKNDDDSIHWPIKKEAVVEGHVILGGLMMVHEREDNMTCGPIMPQGGIQALEAMLFTLDKINEMKLLKNITIGAHILDDCDKDTYGLEMAVDFIRGELFAYSFT